jgi:crotonobetainyl-CoA:carnitine CoA-transferase CaiB-like acyl-CoA transferase
MGKPFDGIRVLDFTQVFAGPFASYQLSLLGADVIKVERPGGEDYRRSVPNDEWAGKSMSPCWMAINANKRNVSFDLKNPKAIEIIKRLAQDADVVMENFRPGVMDRLGIGYEALSAVNPKLIYCALSGFGQSGPEKNTPAYDGKIQAVSGIMSVTGHEEMGPTRAGFAVCDALTGMTGAFAVASAIHQRSHTGKGQMIDVSMLDSTLTFLSPGVADYTVAGHRQGQFGNMAVSRKPTANLFEVKDGYVLLAVNSEKQFEGLMKAIGRPDLLEDQRFVDWPARIANEAPLRAIIEEILAKEDAKTWEARLAEADAPASRIYTIEDAVNHPQLAHREVLQQTEGPDGPVTLIGSGFMMAHGGGSIERPPSEVGQHTEEVLAEAGLDGAEIAELREDGVF